MAHERISQAPFRPGFDEDYRDRPQRLEEHLQTDRVLAEDRASGGKMVLLAICIALVLGAVFYGLNNSSINEASTKPPPAQTAQTQPASPPPPSAARDVTPKANTEPGQTTGAAANRPAPPPPAGQDEDRSAGQKQ
jgi:type IV secretory pathway VirB10-like protein